jgi:glycosyltransferase involved in cell wall biosynthesis
MKALLLSHSNGGGGAGRAAERLRQALVESGIDTSMHVDFKHGDSAGVFRNRGPVADIARRLRITVEEVPAVLAQHPNPRLFSPGLTSAISARRIDSLRPDIVNVHWTNFGYLSISQLARIQSPMAWTLHDMWALTGGLNYADDGTKARWRFGYSDPIPESETLRWDVEKWVWNRKKRNWRKPIHLITPSTWLARLAGENPLVSAWPVRVIPNALDIETYRPMDQSIARAEFGIDPDVRVVLFTLTTDLDDPRKGWDLLKAALLRLVAQAGNLTPEFEIAVIGHSQAPADWDSRLPRTHWLGRIENEQQMALAYNVADVAAVPSRQDNLPQTATEAQACGIPVVAFDIGGLTDIVEDSVTGYVAKSFDGSEFASKLSTLLSDRPRRLAMGEASAARAKALWSPSTVAAAHTALFDEIIAARS